jgi:hypothetical protein
LIQFSGCYSPNGLRTRPASFFGCLAVKDILGSLTFKRNNHADTIARTPCYRYGKIKQVNEYFCTILADEVLFPLVAAEGL